MAPQADLSAKIASLHGRIAKERKIMEGFQAMRAASTNQDVVRTCEAKIRETQKTIGWFEQSLAELEQRQQPGASAGPGASARSSSPASVSPNLRSMQRDLSPPHPGASPAYTPGQDRSASASSSAQLAPRPSRSKAQFTSLDLIKADTPLTSAKISRMLHQLEFKLHVERQYKEGIDKMAKLYLVDGDKRARRVAGILLVRPSPDRLLFRANTENKRVESRQKMILLSQALKKYKGLDVMGELGEDEDSIPEDLRANIRRPLSGALEITVKAARDLAHAPQPKKSKHPSETVIYVKVEDTPRARTHPARNDRWNEDFQIHVDKANEVEVTIYDKVPGEGAPVPIGMLWLRLSDIVEELRRRKMETGTGPGWVTAANVNSRQPGQPTTESVAGNETGAAAGLDMPMRSGTLSGEPNSSIIAGLSEGIDAWFAVEPEGAIMLHLNFVKSNVRKRPYEAGGLGRQGAVRKRKEEIHEQNGHQFVQKQFYAVVMCALCGEFLLKGAGMQCEDCKYACHKNCYHKVVTKCISKSNVDEKDEDQINHRIPHRFEAITNISPNWCCHCGMVLPLGRKGARKCSEPNCGITAHADCVHLVPDFCGMSMLMANQLLSDIKKIHDSKARKPHSNVKPIRSAQSAVQQRSTATSAVGVSDAFNGQFDGPPTASDPSRLQSTHNQAALAEDVGRMVLHPSQHYTGQTLPLTRAGDAAWIPSQPAPVMPPPRQSSVPPQLQHQHLQDSRIVPAYAAPAENHAGPYQANLSQLLKQPQSKQSLPAPVPAQIQSRASDDTAYQQPLAGPAYATSSGHVEHNRAQPPNTGNAYQLPPLAFTPQTPHKHGQQQQPFLQPQQPQPPQLPDPLGRHNYSDVPMPQRQTQQKHQSSEFHPVQQRQHMHQEDAQLTVQQERARQSVRNRRIGLDDFNFLAVLGKGNFGKVMLAEEKRSQQLFAIKVLKKEFIIENDEVESTKSEKRVFLTAARERHPFLLGLHSCFQTETRIYFVMEYVSGGDLMLHIQREQFTPRRAKFYAAEVLLALEYFHQNGIVYRDLKLDNILLTLDGHIKVADYGLCKEEMWYGKTTSTFCGTPEFMAPEIILEQRYGRAVDWWAFGVLIYEMLLGQSPFRGDDEDEIFDAILEDEPLYPIHMPKDSVSILQKLLTRDPARRLGAGEADAAEIKAHLFFKDTNWDDIFHKRVPAPFFPAISSATDTSNFDTEFTSEQPTLTPVHSTLSKQDQAEFTGFSWTATWAA
ncbi:Serine/threonine kinase [Microbotryomycetes sp. JL201]|nr:Serine/threonine kinase [Microbotryomycetes sp. JL201]